MRRSRTVEFIVVSGAHSGEQLLLEIGVEPDEMRNGSGRFSHKVTWVMQAFGDGESDLSVLLENLLERVRPSIPRIEQLAMNRQVSVVLRIVQYIGDDPVGPGFSLDASALETLARAKAVLDVDQYLDLKHGPENEV